MTADEVLQALRADLPIWASASLFASAGIAAALLFLSADSRRGRPRTLLYFAIFMTLYATRLVVDSVSGGMILGLGSLQADQLVSAISYFISIPAVMYVREIEAERFKPSFARVTALLALLGAASLAVDLVGGTAGAATSLHSLIAMGFFIVMLVRLVGNFATIRQSVGPNSARVLGAGSFVLAFFVVQQNLQGIGVISRGQNFEHFGFLAFTLAVGYVTARRVGETQASLAAVEQELGTARRIQAGLLPKKGPKRTSVRAAARIRPMTAVGGDFYDYVDTRDGVALIIADGAGHGIGAALLASMVKVVSAAAREHAEHPALALATMNRILCDAETPGFATAAWLYLSPESTRWRYSAAGHPPLMIRDAATASVTQVTENGLLLGAFEGSEYTEREQPLSMGDRVLLYTDGVMEASNVAGDEFGLERLATAFGETSNLALEAQADALMQRLDAFTVGAPQSDDITFVLAETIS